MLKLGRAWVVGAACAGWPLAGTAGCGSLPPPAPPRTEAASPDEAAVERQVICVGSTTSSAGELASTLYYRQTRLPDGRVAVGYYVFFSEERPWGNNWLTWTVVPALLLDLFYTRSLLALPGLQRLAYGKGDVEGFRVVYDRDEDGRLHLDHAIADDGGHREVLLDRKTIYAIDPERPTFYSDVWSHQLGAKGARSEGDLAYRRCYGDRDIRPLPEEVARDFRLDRRALPAAVVPAPARPRTRIAGRLP